MGPFKNYIDSVLEVWNDATPAARVGIVLLATLCITAIAGVGYWSSQPSYVSLLSETDSEKMDKVIDALDKAGIEYDLSGAGGNLRVDKRDYSKARMIARGKGVSTDPAADFISGGAFSSPTERKNLAIVRQQQKLALAIKKINVVDGADVFLNVPEKGPFERKTSPPSASVMLTLAADAKLSDSQAYSIASLVAFAVEDLEPEAVQITDKEGRSYSAPDEQVHHISSQREYVSMEEQKLARKAEKLLVQFLGIGNAEVEVTLDMTFTNGTITTTSYDPDGKVAATEDLVTSSTKNELPKLGGPGGGTGIDANLQSGRRGKDDVLNKSETINTTYKVPETVETQTNTTPKINRMTVAVLVNSAAEGIQQEDGTLLPGISDQVRSTVENAVGFKSETDSISVELFAFPTVDPLEDVAAPFDWQPINEIIRNASLAVAAIVAFLIGFLILRKIKPSTPPAESTSLNNQRANSLNQLSELVKNNPEVFSQIVKSWTDSTIAPETENKAQTKSAA